MNVIPSISVYCFTNFEILYEGVENAYALALVILFNVILIVSFYAEFVGNLIRYLHIVVFTKFENFE